MQLLKTVDGLADGTREWRNCFLATARGLGFGTSVLEPCVLVLRGSQQRYHGIIGVAVDDIAGGGDEIWEQAITKLKKRFTFGHWEVGKVKFCSRRSCKQQTDPCALDSLPIGRRKRNCKKTAMRSVLAALGYLARESRLDLSGPVQFCKVVSTGPRCQTHKKPTGW